MKKPLKIIILVAVLAIGWYLGAPLFVDDVVDEEFPVSEVESNEPVVVTEGNFTGADSFHKGSGKATVYQLEDESHLVRFENFSVTNGPALSVFLTKDDGTRLDLGKLKGNMGSQNYSVPADVVIDGFTGVQIYCVPFKVEFATAELK